MSSPPNPDHVNHLMKGVDAWSKWRKANPGEQPRLRGVNLQQRMLAQIDLRGADLYTASFWKANLDDADRRESITRDLRLRAGA